MGENSRAYPGNSNAAGALNEFTTEVVITVIHESSEEDKYFDTVFQQLQCEDSGLQGLLRELQLEAYSEALNAAGLCSVSDLADKLQNDLAQTKEYLGSIGIDKPGHARRLLARLEPSFLCLYSEREDRFCCVKSSQPELSIKEWLSEIKLGYLEKKFENAGYESVHFLIEIMKTKYALTDTDLKEEIGIDKPGYRVRILGKLQSELSRRLAINFDREKTNHSCYHCLMF